MLRHSAFVATLLLVLSAGIARADSVLAVFEFTGVGQNSSLPQWEPFLSYSDPDVVAPPGYIGGVVMDVLDVLGGNEYDLVGDFSGFEALMTNAINNGLYIGFKVPGGTGDRDLTTEFALVSNASSLAPGVSLPDFSGFDLTRVRVIASSYSSQSESTFEVGLNFIIMGNPIPEPASLSLLALGSLMLLRRRGC